MSSRTRRNLLLILGGVVLWYAAVLFLWALQPLSDAVPVGVNPTNNKRSSQTVECNTLFASTPRPPGNLPVLTNLNFEYNRGPCSAVQRDARKVFVLDTLVFVVLVSGLLYFILRPASREAHQLSIA